ALGARNRRFTMTDVKPIPDGYPRVTPSLGIDGASAAIDFYTRVLVGAAYYLARRLPIPAPLADSPPDEDIGGAIDSVGPSTGISQSGCPDLIRRSLRPEAKPRRGLPALPPA